MLIYQRVSYHGKSNVDLPGPEQPPGLLRLGDHWLGLRGHPVPNGEAPGRGDGDGSTLRTERTGFLLKMI